MDETQRAGDQRICQLEVELLNLRSQHQALIDNGAARERGDIEDVLAFDLRFGDLIFGAPAYQVEQALESVFAHPLRPFHKKLLDIRLRAARFAANRVAVDRRVAPAEHGQSLFLRDALEHALALQAAVLVHRQEDHGHAVSAGTRQLHPQLSALAREKYMRNLDEYACAVACLRVATRCAAVGEVDQNLKAFADNLVALFATDAGHQTHATGIVFIPGVIKTLRVWSAETLIQCMHGILLDELFRADFVSRIERHCQRAFPFAGIALVLR